MSHPHVSTEALLELIFGLIMFVLALVGIWQGRGHIVNHFNGVYPVVAADMRTGDEEERIGLTTRSLTGSSTSETARDEGRSVEVNR